MFDRSVPFILKSKLISTSPILPLKNLFNSLFLVSSGASNRSANDFGEVGEAVSYFVGIVKFLLVMVHII